LDSFSSVKDHHKDTSDLMQFLVEDDLVSSCMDCTFVSMHTFGNYVYHSCVPDSIILLQREGYSMLQKEWDMDHEFYTLYNLTSRKTVKIGGKVLRRSAMNVVTIFPMLNLFKHTHFW
jgi:hypothetical protein